MKNLSFQIIDDFEKAQEVWNLLSPHHSIDDEWEFRYSFIKNLNFRPHFILGYEGSELFGLLPLQLNTRQGLSPSYLPEKGEFLEFFGGDDTDDNILFLKGEKDAELEKEFLSQITQQAIFAPLKYEMFAGEKGEFYIDKYILPLKGMSGYEDYIEKVWEGSKKKKLKQQMRGLYNKFTIEVNFNEYKDMETLFNLNIARFGERSSFSFPYRRQVFKDLINLYQVELISLIVDGIVEAVSYGIVFKSTYIGMNAGTNNNIPDLGKLLVLLQIDRAISLGCMFYDGGKGSGVWKEEFGFNKIPQYILSKAVI